MKKQNGLSNNEANVIASAFSIGTGQTLRRYLRKLDDGNTIEVVEDSNRSGRPIEVTSQEMRDKFLQYLASRQYHVTVRSVHMWLKAERGTGCTDSATKLLNSVGCRRVRVHVKPKLSRTHMLSRFLYCWERLEEIRISQITKQAQWDIEVFVDEKWFDKITTGGYLWLPNNVRIEQAAEFWRHKTHVPKIMYFAAIAMPLAKQKFDGRVYFEPLVQKVTAKRTTKNRKSGTESLRAAQMDRVKFNNVIIEVLNAIVRKLPNAKKIRIIADGAGGHGVGKHGQRGLENALKDARNWIELQSTVGQIMHGRTIQFLLQPSQSPDLNILDLGAWWSLETDVNELRYNPQWIRRSNRPNELLADLNETVLKSWESWKTSEMLKKLHTTLHRNYWSVLCSVGRNDYDRRSAPSNPTINELSDLLQKSRSNPIWSEAFNFREESIRTSHNKKLN